MSAAVDPAVSRLVAAALVPMAVIDVATRVVLDASPAFEALLHRPVRGVDLREAFPEAGQLHAMLDAAAAGGGEAHRFGLEVFGLDDTDAAGTPRTLDWEWAVSPIAEDDGSVRHALLTGSDVSGTIEVVERVEMLEGLVSLSRRVAGADDEASLYEMLAHDIGLLLGAGGCVILRLDTPSNRNPDMRTVRPMLPAFGIDSERLRGQRLILTPDSAAWQIVREGRTFATDDVAGDPALGEYRDFFLLMGAKNGVAVPMRIRGTTLAILVVANKPGGFSDRDLDLAEVFAAEAALATENVRLFEHEHRVATTLQEALLPGPIPHIRDLDLHAVYRPAGPAGSVGGDFYDVFRMHGGRYGMLLGDVSGKGPTAAAQTALVRHMARGLALNEDAPGPVVAELNRAVWEQTSVEGFITMLYGVYDVSDRQLRWANAGHCKPLFWRRGQPAVEFGECGLALGITARADLRLERIQFAPGDVMVWYTDGLSEARRAGGEMLGVPPLLRTLEGAAERSADEIAEALYRRAVAHAGHLEDDCAILVIKATA